MQAHHLIPCIVLLNALCSAQTTVSMWTRIPTIARFTHAMAYDASRQRVVMFGGKGSSSSPLSDTWEWDGKVWTQIKPTTSPTGRLGHAMTYDASRQRVVLFGGMGDSGL